MGVVARDLAAAGFAGVAGAAALSAEAAAFVLAEEVAAAAAAAAAVVAPLPLDVRDLLTGAGAAPSWPFAKQAPASNT